MERVQWQRKNQVKLRDLPVAREKAELKSITRV
jgi:hypothetical protein